MQAKDYRGRGSCPRGLVEGRSNYRADWEVLEVILPKGELLTMDPQKAKEYGFVTQILEASSKEPYTAILKHYNAQGEPTVLEDSWSERLVDFLNSPLVTAILTILGLMAVFSEMRTPGLGIAAVVAILCFATLLGSHYLVGMAQWGEIGLFAVGLVLIILEVFVIPGFGVAGISGTILCVVALLAMVIPNAPTEFPWPKTSLDWEAAERGVVPLLVGFIIAVIGGGIMSRYLPKAPGTRRLFLGPVEHVKGPPVSAQSPMAGIRVGATGEVVGMCRPVGKVRFGDDLLDATSDGEIIEPGTKVRVVRHEGNRLVIERV